MIAPWVTVGPEPYLATCQRCGGTIEKPPLPMAMGAFTRLLEAQGARHNLCRLPARRVIIESPFAGDTDEELEANAAYLARCILDSLGRGEAPFASHGFYTRYLDDKDPVQRLQGITAGQAWMDAADLVAVYEDRGISPGMNLGITAAHELDVAVEFRHLDGAP